MNQDAKTRNLIDQHCKKYPRLDTCDLLKFLFQSSFGCEHLAGSLQTAVDYIANEYESLCPHSDGIIDELDGDFSRVHLSYLNQGLSVETFGKIFCASAKKEPDGILNLERKLTVLKELARENAIPFSSAEIEKAADEWKIKSYPSIHHSNAFRLAYKPAYRVISNRYIPFLALFARLDKLLKDGNVILAIEGGSASGKTTLGEMLKEIYGCTVLHMDDFFLRPEQRTKERYEEVGGNIDRERFLSEVLIPLRRGEPIQYRRFDCGSMTVLPATEIVPNRLTVVEGAYSMHPNLSCYYDLSVFLDVSPELQKRRILKRNSPNTAERFFNEWIPLEKNYFSEMHGAERCDISVLISE